MTHEPLEKLREHWAITAIGHDSLERADELCFKRLADQSTENQTNLSFTVNSDDDSLLERVALAYELIAIEGICELSGPSSATNDGLKEQTIAAAARTFDFRRILSVPTEHINRVYFVLQLSMIAYCGDRWADLRQWYQEHFDALKPPRVEDIRWDEKVLYRLYECWIKLFRQESMEDLIQIPKVIAELRNEQKTFERDLFHSDSGAKNRMLALRLAALYNWAKCTEILATYMVHCEPRSSTGELDKHFKSGVKAAAASGDTELEMLLRWAHATSQVFVSNRT